MAALLNFAQRNLGAFRTVARRPGLAGCAAASFALAVGANTAVFSIVNALWLRPLQVAEPAQLVVAYTPSATSVDGGLVDAFQRRFQPALEHLAAFSGVTFELSSGGLMGDWTPVIAAGDGRPIRVRAVAHNYFNVLGVPVDGRTFRPEDDVFGAEPVAIVAKTYRARVSADGRYVATTSGPISVIGVVASAFAGARLGDQIDVWIPLGALSRFSGLAATNGGIQRLMPLTVVGRLQADTSLEVGQDQIRGVLGAKTELRRLRDVAFPLKATGDLRRQYDLLQALWLSAGLVLLLGCGNIASLFLARSEARAEEFAVRICLGSSRSGLVGLIVGEVSAIAAGGLVLGLLVRWFLLTGIGSLVLPSGLTVNSLDPTVDWRVFAFATFVAVLAGAVAISSTAWRATKFNVASREALIGSHSTPRSRRARQILLSGHVSFSMVLTIMALALLYQIGSAYSAGFGFNRAETLFVSVRPRLVQYARAATEADGTRRVADFVELLDRVRRIPKVKDVTWGPVLVQANEDPPPESRFVIDGQTRQLAVALRQAGPGYLTLLGASFGTGRDIAKDDATRAIDIGSLLRDPAFGKAMASGSIAPRPPGQNGYPSAVLDQRLANALWPGASPLGKRFAHGFANVTYEVVGVIREVRHGVLSDTVTPTLVTYQPLTPDTAGLDFVVLSNGQNDALRRAISGIVQQLFPEPALLHMNSADDILAIRTARQRLVLILMSSFAVIALTLGVVGIFGLVRETVSSTKRQLGIRSALGASAVELRMVVARGVLAPVVYGTAAGSVMCWQLASAFSSAIGGIGPGFSAYAVAACFMFVSSSVAAFLGATAIRNIEPGTLLRAQP